jgi:hypothetical protein
MACASTATDDSDTPPAAPHRPRSAWVFDEDESESGKDFPLFCYDLPTDVSAVIISVLVWCAYPPDCLPKSGEGPASSAAITI